MVQWVVGQWVDGSVHQLNLFGSVKRLCGYTLLWSKLNGGWTDGWEVGGRAVGPFLNRSPWLSKHAQSDPEDTHRFCVK